MHLRLLIILAASVRFCAGHGNLLKAVFPQDQVVCAGTAPGSLCTPTDGVRARTLIARAGVCDGASDSECDRQPYACDHCGLERKETNDRLPGAPNSNWWTGNPAAHWNDRDVWPKHPCMSDQPYGQNGVARVRPGDSVETTVYINADHSGLYQYQLFCGESALSASTGGAAQGGANEKFFGCEDGACSAQLTPAQNDGSGPISPWRALHPDKEGVSLGEDRVVGTTKEQTDRFLTSIGCVGAGCGYRINDGQPITSGYCDGRCFLYDTVAIPTGCSGPATLRWMWLSAETPEVYANCVDLNIEDAGGGSPSPSPSPIPDDDSGECTASGTCLETQCCSNPQERCYQKDEYWAGCLESCMPGMINEDDPLQYQTAWSCILLSQDTDAPSPSPLPPPPSPSPAPPPSPPPAAATSSPSTPPSPLPPPPPPPPPPSPSPLPPPPSPLAPPPQTDSGDDDGDDGDEWVRELFTCIAGCFASSSMDLTEAATTRMANDMSMVPRTGNPSLDSVISALANEDSYPQTQTLDGGSESGISTLAAAIMAAAIGFLGGVLVAVCGVALVQRRNERIYRDNSFSQTGAKVHGNV